MNNSSLCDFELLIKWISENNPKWEGHRIVCKKKWAGSCCDTLSEIIKRERLTVEITDKEGYFFELKHGDYAAVSIDLPKNDSVFICEDVAGLLKKCYVHNLPEKFYVHSPRINSEENAKNIKHRGINRVASFLQALTKYEVLDADSASQCFTAHTHNGRTSIPFNKDDSFLLDDYKGLERAEKILSALFSDGLYAGEKRRILRSLICESVKACDPDQRLFHFLRNGESITQSAQDNYDIFVTQFSFQDDKEKLYEQKREFSVKLNGLLIGIQAKLIAIPISVVVAVTQFKEASDPLFFEINSSIYISSIVFSLLIVWLVSNQLYAISSIKTEVLSKERRLKLEIPRIYKDVKSVFRSLKFSCNLNYIISVTVLFSTVALFVFVSWVFYERTPAAGEFVVDLLRHLIE